MQSGKKVVSFITDLHFEDIPAHVRSQGKRCLLDTMGAVIAGTATPLAALSAAAARKDFGNGACTLLYDGSKVAPVAAAMANGFASNALDVEHGYRPSQGRPGAALIPVLLAALEAEDARRSGKDLLTAVIIGYEVAVRTGMMVNIDPYKVYTSGLWGGVGAVAGAARLLGMDARQTSEALGCALYHGPIGLIDKGVSTPCMAKDGVGWGAMAAMTSLSLARQGFTSPVPEFDAVSAQVDELGRDYRMLGLYFKPFCCCRWAQAAVTGALNIMRDHKVTAEDITGLTIRTFARAASLSREHPTHTDAAQYNITYPIAVAVLDGEIGGRQVLPPRIFDKEVLRFADMIKVEVAEEFQAEFPAKTFSEVIITTRDGRKLASGPLEPKWEPPMTPSDVELQDKFMRLTSSILGEQEASRLADAVWHIEEKNDALEVLPRVFFAKH